MRPVRYFRYGLSAAILIFGALASGVMGAKPDLRWVLLTVGLYALPLAAQFARSVPLRVYGLWLGVFLIAQSIASPYLLATGYRTLPPDMNYAIDVVGNGLPGIRGIQKITTDSKGFRATPEVDYDKKRGVRIFAIGGSTTEEILLDDRATWTFHLQRLLAESLGSPVEVINAGVSGLRAVHHLATFRRIVRYDPDLVLFLVGVNDWNKHIREHFGSTHYHRSFAADLAFEKSMIGSVLRQARNAIAPSMRKRAGETLIERGAYYAHQRNSLARPDRRRFLPARVDDGYAATLEAIGTACRNKKTRCVFLTQPHGYSPGIDRRYRESFWMTPPNERYTLTLESMTHVALTYNEHLVAFGRKSGHPVVDVAGRIEPGFGNFFDDVHYNTRGAQRVARVLASALLRLIRGNDRPAEPTVGSGVLDVRIETTNGRAEDPLRRGVRAGPAAAGTAAD